MSNTCTDWRKDTEVLYSKAKITARIEELGQEIASSYEPGTELCVVGVLKGSVLFFADLIRAIEQPLHCEFIGISSYGDATKSSGVVKITSDLTHSIESRHVLIVEDIIDTGLTMQYLLKNFETRGPASVKVCTLLDKPVTRKVEVPIHFTGFECPDAFVVGYGLDYAGKFRNLPFIGVYHGDA